MSMDNQYLEDVFNKFGDNVIHRAKFYLARRDKNTKNQTLSNSLKFNTKVYPSGGLEMDFIAADYMPYVEYGRLPGKMPPVSAIKEWIAIKPLKLRDKKTGKFKKKSAVNINSVAFAIALNIKAFGIKPSYFFRDAFAMHRKRLPDELARAYGLDSNKYLKSIINKQNKK